jgi:hypothetical protein
LQSGLEDGSVGFFAARPAGAGAGAGLLCGQFVVPSPAGAGLPP